MQAIFHSPIYIYIYVYIYIYILKLFFPWRFLKGIAFTTYVFFLFSLGGFDVGIACTSGHGFSFFPGGGNVVPWPRDSETVTFAKSLRESLRQDSVFG